MNEFGRFDDEVFQLAHLVVRTGKLAEAYLDGSLGTHTCLTMTRLFALRHIGQAEKPIPLGQLAARLSFVKSNITQLVDRLEAEQLVRRIPDPEDRRCILVELTDKGRQECEQARQSIEPIEAELASLYSTAERQQLMELLARLSAAWH